MANIRRRNRRDKPGTTTNASGNKVRTGGGKTKTRKRKVVLGKPKVTMKEGTIHHGPKVKVVTPSKKKPVLAKSYKKSKGKAAYKAAKSQGRVVKKKVTTTKSKKGLKGNKY